MQYASLFTKIKLFFARLKHNSLLRKMDQCGRFFLNRKVDWRCSRTSLYQSTIMQSVETLLREKITRFNPGADVINKLSSYALLI